MQTKNSQLNSLPNQILWFIGEPLNFFRKVSFLRIPKGKKRLEF